MPGFVTRPSLVRGLHFHEYIPGIKHLLRNDSFAGSNFHNFFRRNQYAVNLVLEIESLHAASEAFRNFSLKPRVGMNDVPILGHELCASGHSEIAQYSIQSHP